MICFFRGLFLLSPYFDKKKCVFSRHRAIFEIIFQVHFVVLAAFPAIIDFAVQNIFLSRATCFLTFGRFRCLRTWLHAY